MNLEKAEALFNGVRIKDRFKRSMYLSAARSFIFNEIVSLRVKAGNWCQAMLGDVMLLDNSHSYFLLEEINEAISQRLQEHDIHPSGALWGKGDLLCLGDVKKLECSMKEKFPLFTAGLEKKGLKQERRALRLSVQDLQWEYEQENCLLILSFNLPAGGYATSVLREIVNV